MQRWTLVLDQQVKEDVSSSLLCSGETPPGTLHSPLGSPAQEIRQQMEVSPEEAGKVITGMEHLYYENRLRELGCKSDSRDTLEQSYSI